MNRAEPVGFLQSWVDKSDKMHNYTGGFIGTVMQKYCDVSDNRKSSGLEKFGWATLASLSALVLSPIAAIEALFRLAMYGILYLCSCKNEEKKKEYKKELDGTKHSFIEISKLFLFGTWMPFALLCEKMRG